MAKSSAHEIGDQVKINPNITEGIEIGEEFQALGYDLKLVEKGKAVILSIPNPLPETENKHR